jgi:GAF domain-containing protein
VRDLDLLDTPPDAEFDRITALAARIFDVPIAVISLVDEKRVWLKSRHGFDRAEVERSRGLGASGSLHDHTLVVEDLRTDPRTAGRPEVQASPIRFYAGVPLITEEGYNLGTMAVADTVPRPMSSGEIASLEDLGAMALHVMELRRAARRLAPDAGERADPPDRPATPPRRRR